MSYYLTVILLPRTPQVGELDELEKKNKIWISNAVDHFNRGILEWVIGEHIAETFEPL